MDLLINYIFKSIFLPPGLIWITLAVGIVLLWFRPALGKIILVVSLLSGYTMSIGFVSKTLLKPLQTIPALTRDQALKTRAEAIVVLSAGRYTEGPEFEGDTVVDAGSLARLRYGAYLHRINKLPIVVSGGYGFDLHPKGKTIAQSMADSLKNDFSIKNIILEPESRTTAENAFFVKKILDSKGIQRIILVTNAWHMPRAKAIFESKGFEIECAPTLFEDVTNQGALDFLPNLGSMAGTYVAMHEIIGRLWYKIRY